MQITQGMAYGLLANVSAVSGLYMAFYQVLIYFIFGTSRHISMGTCAVTCLMTGKVVTELATVEVLANGTMKAVNPQVAKELGELTPVQIGVTLTFVCAIIDLFMYTFRMGAIVNLLSDTMVSGFTCAAAFHVAASQIKDLLGLKIAEKRENFSIIYTIYNAILEIRRANTTTVIISAVSCLTIIINNEIAKPWLVKKFKIPFPIEIVVVVVSTAVTYFSRINETHKVITVGSVPSGLIVMSMPVFTLWSKLWMDAIIIALVGYTTTLSMALIFAKKLMYEVDANQELLAHGLSNLISTFFTCLPTAAALSRCVVQEAVGGVTQITSIVSCILIAIILLWLGPLFEMLPRCVLASVIIIALKGLLLQVTYLPYYWRQNHWDGIVWVVTFSTTLIVQISVGLAAGVAASIVSLVVQGLGLRATVLGRLGATDLYLPVDHHKAVMEIPGVKIIQYVGGISFASRSDFKDLCYEAVDFDAEAVLEHKIEMTDKGEVMEEDLGVRVIIFDFSSLTFMDPSGVEALIGMQSVLEKLGIALLIAECSGRAYYAITKKEDGKLLVFATVHDAVLFAQANYK